MLFGIFLGKLSVTDYQLPASILAGGTVVGLMSKTEGLIKQKFILMWKVIFSLSGFWAVYNLVSGKWVMLAVGIGIGIVATLIFKNSETKKKNKDMNKSKELENEMENCC